MCEVHCGITLNVAEEGGSGKVLLYEKGAYDEMDVCLMSVHLVRI